MKFLTTTIIVTLLSIGAIAESPPLIKPSLTPDKSLKKFTKRKTKIVTALTKRLENIKQRKVCMSSSTSLKAMQSCRVEKYKDRPFKLKKKMTFEERKEKKLKKMTSRILILEKKTACVQNASNLTLLKACKKQKSTLKES